LLLIALKNVNETVPWSLRRIKHDLNENGIVHDSKIWLFLLEINLLWSRIFEMWHWVIWL